MDLIILETCTNLYYSYNKCTPFIMINEHEFPDIYWQIKDIHCL